MENTKLLSEIKMDGEYVIQVRKDGTVVVFGCDCADTLSDKKKIKELHVALGRILKKSKEI